MKKIFWTTIFWLVVVFGFAFYVRMYDAHMAAAISTWLGATTITSSGELITAGTGDVMTEIATIKTTLTDMQTKLDTLVNGTIPTVSTPSVEATTTGTTK